MSKRTFKRYHAGNLKKLGSSWRRPRGMHNKVRLKRKGHIKSPLIGYGGNKKTLGFYQSKFDYKIVNSEKDLINLDKKYVILSSTLGLKNKLQLLEKLKNLNIKVLNIKDLEKFIKKTQEKLSSKKEQKKTQQKKKEEIKKKLEEKVEEKGKKELTLEEKSEKEELEKRKVLEKPQ